MAESTNNLPDGMAHGPLPKWETMERPGQFSFRISPEGNEMFAQAFEEYADEMETLAEYAIRMAYVVKIGKSYYIPTAARLASIQEQHPSRRDRPTWLLYTQVAYEGDTPVALTDVGSWGEHLSSGETPERVSQILHHRAKECRAEAAKIRAKNR